MNAPASRLGQAGAWFLEGVDALDDGAWSGPSLCSEWSAQQVVAHVVSGDQLVRGRILDATGKDRAGEDLPVEFADRQRRFQEMSRWEPARLREAAHRESERTVAAIREGVEVTPTPVIAMPYGTVPLTVVRGMRLNEYVIHGHDLSPATGRVIPIPDWFIDRALGDSLTMMTRLHQRSPHKGESASFHMHRTDGEGEWVLRAEGGQAAASSEHAKADVAFRGSAEGLYWLLMGRGHPAELGVEVRGDPALAAAFKEWFPGP